MYMHCKKGNSCHRDLSGVMSNTGFSGVMLTIQGIELYIPANMIKRDGTFKNGVLFKINDIVQAKFIKAA